MNYHIYFLFITSIYINYVNAYCIDYAVLSIFKDDKYGQVDTASIENYFQLMGIQKLVSNSPNELQYRFESYIYKLLKTTKIKLSHSGYKFKVVKKKEYDERPYTVRLLDRYPMQYEDIAMYIEDLRNKQFVDILRIGLTKGHRRMDVVKITDKAREKHNPSIWIDCGIHAREWQSVTSCIHFLKYLVEIFENQNENNNKMKNINWYILPVVNIDGYMESIKKDNMIRKNGNGVDLNRNFPENWDNARVVRGKNKKDDVYRGKSPGSEKEVKNLINFFSNSNTSFEALLNMHTYSEAILLPPGYRMSNPREYEDMMRVAKKMRDDLYEKRRVIYSFGEVNDIMNGEYSGLMIEYMKHKQHVKYPFSIELGPKASDVISNRTLLNTLFRFNKNLVKSNANNMITLVESLAESVLNDHDTSTLSTTASIGTHIYVYILAIVCVYSVVIFKVVRIYSTERLKKNENEDVIEEISLTLV